MVPITKLPVPMALVGTGSIWSATIRRRGRQLVVEYSGTDDTAALNSFAITVHVFDRDVQLVAAGAERQRLPVD